MELICGKPSYSFKHLEDPTPEITIKHYRRSNTKLGNYRYWELDPHQILLTYPQTIHGTIPENLPKI